ncbi:MAG: hypothetical protein QM648_06620 [Solirubrobacterales bacterium]
MSRRFLLICAFALCAVVLTGCDTTRAKNDRAKIATDRVVVGDKGTKVRKAFSDVRVEQVALLRSGRRAAIAVLVTSHSDQTLSDLPIVVGVNSNGKRKQVNGRARQPYFDSHVPALAAGGSTWWVYAPARRVPHGKPYAIVGAPSFDQRPGRTIPKVELSRVVSGAHSVKGTVKNSTGFPQYQILLYAVALKGRAVVAAGSASNAKFGTGEEQTFQIKLVGRPPKGTAKPTAVPAILAPYR